MFVSVYRGRKFPVIEDFLSSHEQEIYSTTSLDENCLEFEFQTDRNWYVELRQSYLVLKPKIVKGGGYEVYNSKEVKKEHKEEAKRDDEMPENEDMEESLVPLIIHVNNILL